MRKKDIGAISIQEIFSNSKIDVISEILKEVNLFCKL